jgi:hypothetical protein
MTEHVTTPDSGHPELEDEHTRIADKRRFTGKPEMQGVPDDEDVESADVEERLDQDPEDEDLNRRDVPSASEGDRDGRTEDA